jgi:hypothetical protein
MAETQGFDVDATNADLALVAPVNGFRLATSVQMDFMGNWYPEQSSADDPGVAHVRHLVVESNPHL